MSGARWLWRWCWCACVPDSSRPGALPRQLPPGVRTAGRGPGVCRGLCGGVGGAQRFPGLAPLWGRVSASCFQVASPFLCSFWSFRPSSVPSFRGAGLSHSACLSLRVSFVPTSCRWGSAVRFRLLPPRSFVLSRGSRSGLLTPCCVETPTVQVACLTPPSCLPATPWPHGRPGLRCPFRHQVSCACRGPRSPRVSRPAAQRAARSPWGLLPPARRGGGPVGAPHGLSASPLGPRGIERPWRLLCKSVVGTCFRFSG